MTASLNSTLLTLINDYKLKGPNYNDWHRSLSTVLDEVAPQKSIDDDYDQHEAYEYFYLCDSKAMLYILGSVDKSITDSVKGITSAKGVMDKLKELFSQTDVHEHHELVGFIHNTKMKEGTPIIDHVMKMRNLFEKLKTLDTSFTLKYKRNVIFNSLPIAYSPFVCNFNMNRLDVELTEVGNMLQEVEKAFKKEKGEVNATEVKGSNFKDKGKKNKANKGKTLKGKGGKIQKKTTEPKGKCFFCGNDGH
ncbi:uncharacterized protein LOC122651596 [Telopea speciosissima]|uniref:uncharacterized protein LOC122651596 n=1 Tax=Telopea speciosissima TaxID=54955 RepID=UPI001CC343F8|nr:uncharacterized protein LOC122651596 [Telopea speciosissima]